MGAREGSGDFGGQLRRHREAAGLSQEELAERSALIASVPNRVRPQRSDEAISAPQQVALLLPSEPTPLLGRVDELSIIREELVSPDVRSEILTDRLSRS